MLRASTCWLHSCLVVHTKLPEFHFAAVRYYPSLPPPPILLLSQLTLGIKKTFHFKSYFFAPLHVAALCFILMACGRIIQVVFVCACVFARWRFVILCDALDTQLSSLSKRARSDDRLQSADKNGTAPSSWRDAGVRRRDSLICCSLV